MKKIILIIAVIAAALAALFFLFPKKAANYNPPGPDYHMILIRGYNETTRNFIANDPGTKYGNAYSYSYVTVDRAWHDWTGSSLTVLQGGRNMLIIEKSK